MELRLIPHAELVGTAYAQFYPGPFRMDRFWSENSVYMEMRTFEATHRLVGHFDLFGPETLSGSRLQRCIDDLLATAKRISQSESPEEVWDSVEYYGFPELLETSDWRTERRNFSMMLRDPAVWMREAHARREPVTCLGL